MKFSPFPSLCILHPFPNTPFLSAHCPYGNENDEAAGGHSKTREGIKVILLETTSKHWPKSKMARAHDVSPWKVFSTPMWICYPHTHGTLARTVLRVSPPWVAIFLVAFAPKLPATNLHNFACGEKSKALTSILSPTRNFQRSPLGNKPVKYCIWSIALYDAETWPLRKLEPEYLESFEMWCWRKREQISWTDRVRNEVLQAVKEERNVLYIIKRREANWIGHTLRRNCLLKRVIEGKIEGRIRVVRRRRRRR
jgi:hypothetical protein